MATPLAQDKRKHNGTTSLKAKVTSYSGETNSERHTKIVILGVAALGLCLAVVGIASPRTSVSPHPSAHSHQPEMRPQRLAMAPTQPDVTRTIENTPAEGRVEPPTDRASIEPTSSAYHKRPDPPAPTDPWAFNGAGFTPPPYPTYLDPRKDLENASSASAAGALPAPPEASPSSPQQAAKDEATIAAQGHERPSSGSASAE